MTPKFLKFAYRFFLRTLDISLKNDLEFLIFTIKRSILQKLSLTIARKIHKSGEIEQRIALSRTVAMRFDFLLLNPDIYIY